MPHLRSRHIRDHLTKLSKLWPVVGLIGPRQSGKTTLFRNQLGIQGQANLDELAARNEARNSPDTFIAKQGTPLLIDEIQKAPELFDAIKLTVDRKRIPGSFFITGSTQFSARLGIRESLTGRIGIAHLHPMTYSELHALPPPESKIFVPKGKPRVNVGDFSSSLTLGGMPVPAFLRNAEERRRYWQSWLETTVFRDLAAFFPRGFDGDLAMSLMARMGALFREGEIPTLKHFSTEARVLRRYFSAMEDLFLIRRLRPHDAGVGKDCWIVFDAGLAEYLMGGSAGEGATLSLVRHTLWNAWSANLENTGTRLDRTFLQSAQGGHIDLVAENCPIRIVASATGASRQLKWEERPLRAAIKRLGAKEGYLVVPTDQHVPPQENDGVGLVPWSAWA